MAVSRYVVVCRPLHARGYISLHSQSQSAHHSQQLRPSVTNRKSYISLRRTRAALLAVFQCV